MAAGLGFKTFTTGEVLTAGDVNGYLMQGINVFASEAARNAAITAPQEGQFAFTKDTNSLWYYTGSAWAASGATGDIEGVTAGVGITGGGTSGTVTITNDMATTITASGDIVVGTGSGTYDNLPIGTTGQILTADTTVSPYKVKWATPAGGGGKVLQVVSTTSTTTVSNSTSTFADSNLSLSITPTLATSKILGLTAQAYAKNPGNQYTGIQTQLVRGATQIALISNNAGYVNTSSYNVLNISYNYLDSPATTSATTYKVRFKNTQNEASVEVSANANETASMILMEIGA